MPLILSLALGAVGLVLIRSAFATPPDPREVLRSLFAGGSLFEPSGKSMGTAPDKPDASPVNPNTNRYIT